MFENYSSFYFLGIGGISMSALAQILKSYGKFVCGSDDTLSPLTNDLISKGIEIRKGSSPDFVTKCDALVYTSAMPLNHPDILLAKSLGKKIFSRAEILGEISKTKKTISIAGTHGKTSTSGMFASVLLKSSVEPLVHIGGIAKDFSSNLYLGKGEYFVTEACEYMDNFLSLKNHISIILNIEEDHLDYFKNKENILRSFSNFAQNTNKNGLIILNENIKINLKNRKIITFGVKNADFLAKNIKLYKPGRYCYDLFIYGKKMKKIYLSAFGKHNVLNSLAVIASAYHIGINIEIIANALSTYQGVARRMEILQEGTQLFIHDYAHHPDEIKATIHTLKNISKEKLLVIFQPHTFSRTKDFYTQFLSCFNQADEVWFLPIYPARERPIKNISSLCLAEDLKKKGLNIKYISTFAECEKKLNKNINYSTVAFLGAGDIDTLAYKYKK